MTYKGNIQLLYSHECIVAILYNCKSFIPENVNKTKNYTGSVFSYQAELLALLAAVQQLSPTLYWSVWQ